MTRAGILFLLAALLAPASLEAQERPLPLVDEAQADGTWTSFRARLLAAVDKKDLEATLGMILPDVRNGSDSPRGLEEFRVQWHLNGGDTPFWRELEKALSLGSAWLSIDDKPKELCAPYLLAKWPRDLDPFNTGLIAVGDAPIRAAPSEKAQPIATAGFLLVPVSDWEVNDSDAASGRKWVKLRFKGRDAYVADEQMRSPIEHAACFAKTALGWRMTVFGPAGRD